MLKKTLTALLIVCATSSAPTDAEAQADFIPLPAGSVAITPSGDSIMVFQDSYAVSSGAITGMDTALRQARANEEFYRANYELRTEQVNRFQSIVDTLTATNAANEAWKARALAELQAVDVSWWEKALYGLAGYAVGRAAGY
jgi:hypothetical protein